MKHLYQIFSLVTLPLIFTACQDDIAYDNSAIQNKDTYTLHCIVNSASQSRAQIQLGNTVVENEIFIWNSKDQFMVFNHSDIDESSTVENPNYNTFVIDPSYSDDNPSNSANFTGVVSLEEGQRITAIYPEQDLQNATVENGWIRLSLASNADNSITPTQEGWKEYMSNNMFMYAIADVEGNSTTLQFQHLYAMARITYTNCTDTEQNIREMVLKGNSEKYLFSGDINFNLKTGEKAVADFYNAVVQSYNNEEIIGVGESRDFYLIFFPGTQFGENDSLCVRVNAEMSTPFMSTEVISEANDGAKGFEAGKRYWFNVAQTEEGLVWTKDLPEVEIEGVITNLPLIEAIENKYSIAFIKDKNGYVDVETNKTEIEGIETLTIIGTDNGLKDLKGIEYLKNLRTLWCDYTMVTEIDVSQNTQLKTLYCYNSQLTKLTLGNQPNLQNLDCSTNQLTELDITGCPSLTEFWCYGNQIYSLDVSSNSALTSLRCYNNLLTELDMTGCPNLTELWCYENSITSLNVSNNSALLSLDCENNQLTSLNVSGLNLLEALNCGNNNLSSLSVNNNLALTSLYCGGNHQLTTLDVSQNTKLTSLVCDWTNISSLDVSKLTALTGLTCGGTGITSLNISPNTALVSLSCSNSKLTSLDISKNAELRTLNCYNSHLQELDITHNPQLENLYCGHQVDENDNYITLTLILTSAQKVKWESEWVTIDWGHDTVTPVVSE